MRISPAFAMLAAAHLPKRSFHKAFGDMHNTLVSAACCTLTLEIHAAYIYVHSTEDSLINTIKCACTSQRGLAGWQVYPTSECNRPKIKRHVQRIFSHIPIKQPLLRQALQQHLWRLLLLLPFSSLLSIQTAGRLLRPA